MRIMKLAPAALLAVLAFGSAQALPGPAHTVNGSATNSNGDTVAAILVDELTQGGTVVVNGLPQTVTCVANTSGLIPGEHKIYISAVGSGFISHIEIAESGGNQFFGFGFNPAGLCNVAGLIAPVTSGGFLIVP